MKKFNWRLLTAILIIALLVVATVFVFWASDIYPANEIALKAMESDSQVFVNAERGIVIFYPADNPRPETGFIFYPAEKVDYRAYAPLLKMIANHGYFVALSPAPLNFAVFNSNAAARVEAGYPEIQNWFMGGHSLGGVAASSYVVSHPNVKGLVLFSSIPINDSLRVNDVPTIAIYGMSEDGSDIMEYLHGLLPDNASFSLIDSVDFTNMPSQTGWVQTITFIVGFFQDHSK